MPYGREILTNLKSLSMTNKIRMLPFTYLEILPKTKGMERQKLTD
jgi:hypothetical protein